MNGPSRMPDRTLLLFFLCTGQALLCAAMLGCAPEPEPSRIEVVEPATEPVEAGEIAPGNAGAAEAPTNVDAAGAPSAADVPEAEPEQFVVYFGSFRNYLAAARYAESLRSAGLLQVNIERARGGGSELIVTDPMDRADADALAESLGGRVLSVDSARRLTEDYGSILQ